MRVVMPNGTVFERVVILSGNLAVREEKRGPVLFVIPPGASFLPDLDPPPARTYSGLQGILPGEEFKALEFLNGRRIRVGEQIYLGVLNAKARELTLRPLSEGEAKQGRRG